MGAILIFLLIALAMCIVAFVIESYRDVKRSKEYDNFIQSIKVGDEFGWQEEPDTIKTDPFVERDYSEKICVITDIKENGAGYKWVKYYYKKYITPGYEPTYFTEEINTFVRHRKRISGENPHR